MRPREHYAVVGPFSLSDQSLLALALGTGTAGQPVHGIAADLLAACRGLPGLCDASIDQLQAVPGVGPARAVRLHAALALARRGRLSAGQPPPALILGPEDALVHLRPLLADQGTEALHGLYLGPRGRLLAHRLLTRGSDLHTVVDPRQVMRPAVATGAAALIVAHNHPSGDPSPSEPDVQVTRRLAAAGRVLGVRLLDHLILGRDSHSSLAERGVLPDWSPDDCRWVADPSTGAQCFPAQ